MKSIQNVLFVLFITAYYFSPSPYTKILPALFLTGSSLKNFWIAVAFLYATLGDYYLAIPGGLPTGIVCFAIMHLGLIYGVHRSQNILQILGSLSLIQRKFLSFTYFGLTGLGKIISWQVSLDLKYLVLGYTQMLILSVLSAWCLHQFSSSQGEENQRTRPGSIQKTKPYLYGIILFIISDLFVLSQILKISGVPPIGLILYWSSLRFIHHGIF